MRSLECATSERNRASLWRRWRSSASEAPSTASDTCEASDSSESTSSRGIGDCVQQDEQAARLVADGERQEEHDVALGRGGAGSGRPRAALEMRSCWIVLPDSRSQPLRVLREHPARRRPRRTRRRRRCRLRSAGRGELLAGLPGQGDDGRDRGLVRPDRDPAAATRSTPAPRRASSRDAARSSWRTRPAMRATTSRKRTAEAAISTSRPGRRAPARSGCPGAIRHARASSARRSGVRRVRDSSAGSSSVRIDGCSAAAPQRR